MDEASRQFRQRSRWIAGLYTLPIIVFLVIGIYTGHPMVLLGGILALVGNVGYLVSTEKAHKKQY